MCGLIHCSRPGKEGLGIAGLATCPRHVMRTLLVLHFSRKCLGGTGLWWSLQPVPHQELCAAEIPGRIASPRGVHACLLGAKLPARGPVGPHFLMPAPTRLPLELCLGMPWPIVRAPAGTSNGPIMRAPAGTSNGPNVRASAGTSNGPIVCAPAGTSNGPIMRAPAGTSNGPIMRSSAGTSNGPIMRASAGTSNGPGAAATAAAAAAATADTAGRAGSSAPRKPAKQLTEEQAMERQLRAEGSCVGERTCMCTHAPKLDKRAIVMVVCVKTTVLCMACLHRNLVRDWLIWKT